MGNLASLVNSFAKIGQTAKIIKTPKEIKQAQKLVLPGVGGFGDAAKFLTQNGFKDAILDFVNSGKYLLGVCLGMQLLFEKSQESTDQKGLEILKGEIKKFDNTRLKVPHMGWNRLDFAKNPLFEGVNKDLYLYFVHSYYCVPTQDLTIATANYGIDFTCAINKDNIYAIQPHPEKSHEDGLKILNNFAKL